MKWSKLILAIIGGAFLLYYLNFGCRYIKELRRAKKHWYENKYIKRDIKGVLTSIKQFEDNPYQVVLSIKNYGEEFEINYGVTCTNDEFNNFVAVGDSVFKVAGERVINFCKPQKQCKNFELNFCGKFD